MIKRAINTSKKAIDNLKVPIKGNSRVIFPKNQWEVRKKVMMATVKAAAVNAIVVAR